MATSGERRFEMDVISKEEPVMKFTFVMVSSTLMTVPFRISMNVTNTMGEISITTINSKIEVIQAYNAMAMNGKRKGELLPKLSQKIPRRILQSLI